MSIGDVEKNRKGTRGNRDVLPSDMKQFMALSELKRVGGWWRGSLMILRVNGSRFREMRMALE